MAGLTKNEFKGRVTMYSVLGCTSCAKVKSIITEMGIPFYDVDLAKYTEERKTMFDLTGSRVVPQLFFNDKHIGGYHELKKLLLSGDFEELLKDILENDPPPNTPTIPEELLEAPGGVEGQDKNGCNCGDEECNIFDDSDSEDDTGASHKKEGAYHIRKRTLTSTMDDEYAGIANEIRFQSGIPKNKLTLSLKKYHNSFHGHELVKYLIQRKAKSQEEAIQIGEQLLRRSFIYHITHERNFEANSNYYAFLDDTNKKALNIKVGEIPLREQKPAIMLAAEIRRVILDIYGEFIVDGGMAVNYAGIAQSPKLQLYIKTAEELQRVVITGLSREQTLSFTINVYNALIIHAFAVHGPPTSLLKRYLFYGSACYMISGYYFTLNDLESGILRANRKAVGSLTLPFRKNDPRAQFALKQIEPRIHFALNCGAQSCPPIKTYSAANIYEELTIATQGFLESESGVIVDMAKREIQPSKIFQWYKADFGGSNRSVAEWILENIAPGEKSQNINMLLSSKKYKLRYQNYNWNVNST
ncbi:hypothetical protein LOD99_9184 [Oopsacas minuta]|uniref:DEP domain-containing protein n=1 Tax=Oopsacas minuta TaxID=111878 RepID=A0AAV7JDC3_9METZ|nr:hypothetical protein LOD99_9184 [Oopsacas minuta]